MLQTAWKKRSLPRLERWAQRLTRELVRVAAAAVVLTGCPERAVPTRAKPQTEEVENANFVLYVLNSSRKSKDVDIQVFVDGKLEVDKSFSSEPQGPVLIHLPPHEVFRFRLAPGSHTLKASSSAGAATLEQHFEIKDKHWALIGYEYWAGTGHPPPPGQFEFTIQETPIRFQ
jgi:hypothetical protein